MVFFKLNYRPIFFIIGIFLLVLAAAMLIPATIDFWGDDPNAQSFVGACFMSAFTGGICVLAYRYEGEIDFRVRETFFLTSFAWFVIAFFAALPFVLSQAVSSFSDGLLEAVSSLTTTGFTILEGVDTAPYSLLLWRSLLQWLGGLGIMLMALTLLPFLRIGGMQLFYTEFSDRSEKILPRLSQMTQALLGVYFILTVVCCGLLWWGGMSFFEALCHSLSTISTGGLSTSAEGINHFQFPAIRWILTLFMILSASPLLLFVRMLTGDIGAYFRDTQVRAYLTLLGFSSLFVVLWLWQMEGGEFWESLSNGIFQASSTLTTTGFQNQEEWPVPLSLFFVFLIILGGCTGSTAGGMKIFRFQIMYRILRAQIYQLLHPHGVFIPVYAKRNVEGQVITSVFSFISIYLLSCIILSLGFAICGMSQGDSVLLSLNTLSNAGIGTLRLDAFTTYPLLGKWLVIIGMFLGRLEFFTLLVVCLRPFWRR